MGTCCGYAQAMGYVEKPWSRSTCIDMSSLTTNITVQIQNTQNKVAELEG